MPEKEKKLLFSVTAADCQWEYFPAGGPGGQHQNRKNTACRVTHPPSGAVGESRELKSQSQNRDRAFGRMAQTDKFKKWHRLETARRMLNEQSINSMIDKAVNAAMDAKNIKVEVQDERGRWTPEEKI